MCCDNLIQSTDGDNNFKMRSVFLLYSTNDLLGFSCYYNLSNLTALLRKEMGLGNVFEREFFCDDRVYVPLLDERHHVADLTPGWIVAVETGKIDP